MDGGRRGSAHTQTDLGFGVQGWQAPALEVVRAYLGLSSPLRGAVTVRHHDGRVVLVPSQAVITRRLPYPKVAELPSPYDLLSKEDREGEVVVTLLGTITHHTARARGLYTVNPEGRGVTTRKLAVGQAPVDVTPASGWGRGGSLPAPQAPQSARPLAVRLQVMSPIITPRPTATHRWISAPAKGHTRGFPGRQHPSASPTARPPSSGTARRSPIFRDRRATPAQPPRSPCSRRRCWLVAPSGYRKITKSPNSSVGVVGVPAVHHGHHQTLHHHHQRTRREALQIARGLRPI